MELNIEIHRIYICKRAIRAMVSGNNNFCRLYVKEIYTDKISEMCKPHL